MLNADVDVDVNTECGKQYDFQGGGTSEARQRRPQCSVRLFESTDIYVHGYVCLSTVLPPARVSKFVLHRNRDQRPTANSQQPTTNKEAINRDAADGERRTGE